MAEGTTARPQAGVAKMPEVSGETGQVGGGATQLQGGVYRHPATKEEIIAMTDPITGDAQARGYVRAGFEWVRDVKEDDVKVVGLMPSEDFAKQPEREIAKDNDELRSLRARLAALEAQEDKRKENERQNSNATVESQEHAQDAAFQKMEERGTDNSGDVSAHGGVNTPVTPLPERTAPQDEQPQDGKPLDKQNREELNATAQAEGVEDPQSFQTKNELVAAIEDKRGEKGDK